MSTLVKIVERIHHLVSDGTLRRFGVFAEHIAVLKPGADAPGMQALLRNVRRNANSLAARDMVKRMSRQMDELEKQLVDVPCDLSPLPFKIDRSEGETVRRIGTPASGGMLLYGLIRALKPKRVVEVGAAHGIGSCYLAAGLRDNGHPGVRLVTLEGARQRIELARSVIDRQGLSNVAEVVFGDFRETFPRALADAAPVDATFNDGDKSIELTEWEFECALAAMPGGGWLIYDDIDFSPEIEALWQRFVAHPRIGFAVGFMQRWGMLELLPAA